MRNVIYLFLESPKWQNGRQVYNILYVGQTDSASFSSTVSTRDSPPAALLIAQERAPCTPGLPRPCCLIVRVSSRDTPPADSGLKISVYSTSSCFAAGADIPVRHCRAHCSTGYLKISLTLLPAGGCRLGCGARWFYSVAPCSSRSFTMASLLSSRASLSGVLPQGVQEFTSAPMSINLRA